MFDCSFFVTIDFYRSAISIYCISIGHFDYIKRAISKIHILLMKYLYVMEVVMCMFIYYINIYVYMYIILAIWHSKYRIDFLQSPIFSLPILLSEG